MPNTTSSRLPRRHFMRHVLGAAALSPTLQFIDHVKTHAATARLPPRRPPATASQRSDYRQPDAGPLSTDGALNLVFQKRLDRRRLDDGHFVEQCQHFKRPPVPCGIQSRKYLQELRSGSPCRVAIRKRFQTFGEQPNKPTRKRPVPANALIPDDEHSSRVFVFRQQTMCCKKRPACRQ